MAFTKNQFIEKINTIGLIAIASRNMSEVLYRLKTSETIKTSSYIFRVDPTDKFVEVFITEDGSDSLVSKNCVLRLEKR